MLEITSNNNNELTHPPLPIKPRLTMKYLHILIQDLLVQDQLLSQRIAQLELQLIEFNHSRDEIAAADEQLRNEVESTTQGIESQSIQRPTSPEDIQSEGIQPLSNQTQANQTQEIRISRAERHAPLKKKSFRFWK